MSKPTIVLVHGAWHRPVIYNDVVASLSKHGYPTVPLALPSADASIPHEDFTGDVATIRDCLTELVSNNKEVVLVVHSYSGLPGGEAPKGLGRKEREAKGLKGGVIRYVVINGFAMPEGYRPHVPGDYSKMPEWHNLNAENGTSTVPPEAAKEFFYNDLPSARADEFAAQLVPQSLGVFFSTSTYAAWRDIPSTYIIGELDRSPFTPEVSEFMINQAQQIEPSAFDVVERSKEGGHCLMASYPDWTANALRRAAGEKL